ncbi:cytochrome c [Aliiruegeria haliotis]|uniref:Cytochrome c n=1 Tax=Aliiruegeria haliotis TaxID=1280846 RepID=A0A2T0RPF8_9RHOB|nr:c-type cytochrome [Aliiruegeria haliotis]PRY23075.1 cytochrome c [Aliiruegeria haliotis]
MRAALALALFLPAAVQAGEFFTLKGHGGPIKGIAVSPEGDAILTASFDNSLGHWLHGKSAWLEAHSAAANTVRFVNETQAISAGDDFALYLWDLRTATPRLLGHHKGKVLSLAVSTDSTRAASASWDGSIGLWDLAGDGAPRFLTGHTAGVNDVAFATDGTTLYSGSSDGSIRTWDVETGTQTGQLLNNGFGVNTLVLNEAAGWLAYGAVDGVTRIVDLATGEQIKDLTLERRPILAMAADRKLSRLAIGDGEGYISVIDTATWSFIADFRATLRGPIWALAFSADGENIHAGGLDDAMYSWPVDGTDDAPRMVQQDRTFLRGAETASNGERQFNRKCSICHALGPDGERRAGPTLHGLFGRPAGSVDGYSYSETLEKSDIIWSADTVDALFDLGPDVYIEGSKMPMQRITGEEDRSDLVEYLQEATRPMTED